MKKDKEKKDLNQMDPYAIDRLHKVPFWIKATILKYWFYGAIYFFMLFGTLGGNGINYQLIALLSGLISGALYDVVINKIIMLWETDEHEGQYFSMIISKKYYAFIINVIYNIFLFIVFYVSYELYLGPFFQNTLKWNRFGQEPFSFALLMIILDGLCLSIKYLVIHVILKRIRNR